MNKGVYKGRPEPQTVSFENLEKKRLKMTFSAKMKIWATRFEMKPLQSGRSRLERKAFYDAFYRGAAEARRNFKAQKNEPKKPLPPKFARNLARIQLARKLRFSGKSKRAEAYKDLEAKLQLEELATKKIKPAVVYGA